MIFNLAEISAKFNLNIKGAIHIGAFVGEELRGVGLAEVVPEALGGGYSFNILVYVVIVLV